MPMSPRAMMEAIKVRRWLKEAYDRDA